VIGAIISHAEIFLMVGFSNKFAKVCLSDFVISLDNGMMFEGKCEVYELTSYPYTRFMGEPRLMIQMELSFDNMTIVLTNLKVVFMMEVTMRLIDYVLTQVDNLMALLNSQSNTSSN
jgi:hypothetical protein